MLSLNFKYKFIWILAILCTISTQGKSREIYCNEQGKAWTHLEVEFFATYNTDFDILLNVKDSSDYMILRVCYGNFPLLKLYRHQYGYNRAWMEIRPAQAWTIHKWYRLSIKKAPWIDKEDWRAWKIIVADNETGQILLKQGIENEMPAFGVGKVGIQTNNGIKFRNFQCILTDRQNKQNQLRIAPLFGNDMVLQQNKPIPIWGMANPGEEITILFHNRKYQTAADKSGNWKSQIDACPVLENQTLEIIAGDERLLFTNIAVGEVWLASGQSNMEMRSWQSDVAAIVSPNTPDAKLRFFVQPQWPAENEMFDSGGAWIEADSIHAMGVSAIAYRFGQLLREKLKRPVGIVCSYWGGTAIESWIPQEKLVEDSLSIPIWKRYKQYEKSLKENRPINSTYPDNLDIPGQRHSPGYLFNGMIAPLAPYAIKGIIWYQGESNSERARQYEVLFPMLVDSWRERWKEMLPFYYVQLAGYDGKLSGSEIDQAWPQLRDSQRKLLEKREKVGMVTAIDLGNQTDIHPYTKMEVGNRLARMVLHDLYHHTHITRCGPLYNHVEFKENKAYVYFNETGERLSVSKGDELKGFTIAGNNKTFYPAKACIDKQKDYVVLYSEQVKNPVAVRYAWANNPTEANLVNSDNLPAASFRTDSWELPTDHNF